MYHTTDKYIYTCTEQLLLVQPDTKFYPQENALPVNGEYEFPIHENI